MSTFPQVPALSPNLQCDATLLQGGHLQCSLIRQQSCPNGVTGFTPQALLLCERAVSVSWPESGLHQTPELPTP